MANLSLCKPWEVHGGKEVQFHLFVINTLHWDEKFGFTLRPFFLRRRSAHCPLNTKQGEPQSQPGRFTRDIILKILVELEPRLLGCPVGSDCFIPIYRREQQAPCTTDSYVDIHGPW